MADFFVRVIDDSCESRSLFERWGEREGLSCEGVCIKTKKRDQTSGIESDAKASEEMSV